MGASLACRRHGTLRLKIQVRKHFHLRERISVTRDKASHAANAYSKKSNFLQEKAVEATKQEKERKEETHTAESDVLTIFIILISTRLTSSSRSLLRACDGPAARGYFVCFSGDPLYC
jgi:hypothetical protein